MQMMKPNLEELPELVTLAAKLGADEVIAPNLDYIPTNAVDALKAFSPSTIPHHSQLVNEAQARGKELGIKVNVDTGLPVGHIGEYGLVYPYRHPNQPAYNGTVVYSEEFLEENGMFEKEDENE